MTGPVLGNVLELGAVLGNDELERGDTVLGKVRGAARAVHGTAAACVLLLMRKATIPFLPLATMDA